MPYSVLFSKGATNTHFHSPVSEVNVYINVDIKKISSMIFILASISPLYLLSRDTIYMLLRGSILGYFPKAQLFKK